MTIEQEIIFRLEQAFQPTYLELTNMSHLHAGHAGVAGIKSAETHFKLKISSESLDKINRIDAQRKVYRIIGDLMNNPIHALEIIIKPSEAL